MRTIRTCLAQVGLTTAALSSCTNLSEEWTKVKKAYFKKVLATHPDKGGDAAVFRTAQEAFEVLRSLFESSAVASFASSGDKSTESAYADATAAAMPTPSWEFYAAAAQEPVPLYRVELAKSGRSKGKDGALISKGKVRIGSLDEEAGSYGRWSHLGCWRVPSKIWLGLPDPDKSTDPTRFEAALAAMNGVLLCGVSELPPAERRAVARHAMDKANWARLTKRAAPSAAAPPPAAAPVGAGAAMVAGGMAGGGSSAARTLVSQAAAPKERFSVPVPGRDGATAGSLAGQTLVLTGVFPEVGGGAGLDLGKARVKAMVESFGGKACTRATR